MRERIGASRGARRPGGAAGIRRGRRRSLSACGAREKRRNAMSIEYFACDEVALCRGMGIEKRK
jgi:hypothetical protein